MTSKRGFEGDVGIDVRQADRGDHCLPSTHIFPRQLPKLRTASPAMPASNILWLAMAMKIFLALAASRSPFSFGHVCRAATFWSRSNFQAFLLPDAIMAVIGTNQRMSDFVQDRVNDL